MLPRKQVSLKIRNGAATPMTRTGLAPACWAVRGSVLGFGVPQVNPVLRYENGTEHAGEVWTSEARKIGVPLVARQGRVP
jgi:hypothetical protein